MQKYTSKETSINQFRLPSVYSKVKFVPYSTVLDYGCGKYTYHIYKRVREQNCRYIPYDPYNLPNSQLPNEIVSYAVCSNVLNVIDDIDEIKRIIRELCNIAYTVYITVYEGDKSGIGRVTKEDCYQRNNKLSFYVRLIKELGYEPTVKNKVIKINPVFFILCDYCTCV